MKVCVFICFASVLFGCAQAITFPMERYQYFCLFKELSAEEKFLGSYVVSGYDETSVILNIISPGGRIVHSVSKMKEGQWNFTITEAGEYRLCFRNLKKDPVYISVDLGAHKADKHDTGAISTKEIGKMVLDLRDALRLLWKVRTNLKFQNVRGDVHNVNLKTLQSRIKWSSLYKISVLGLIALGQGYVLTNLFKKRGKLVV